MFVVVCPVGSQSRMHNPFNVQNIATLLKNHRNSSFLTGQVAKKNKINVYAHTHMRLTTIRHFLFFKHRGGGGEGGLQHYNGGKHEKKKKKKKKKKR